MKLLWLALLVCASALAQFPKPVAIGGGSSGGGGGGGATIPSTTDLIKGDGSGNGADTKVTLTAPATAWTITPAGDNQTTTIPGGTLLNSTTGANAALTNLTGIESGAVYIGSGTSALIAGGASLDTSGNLGILGVLSISPSGLSHAGEIIMGQGTTPVGGFPGNSFALYTPTSIASAYQWVLPAADAAGAIVSSGAGTPGVLSIVGFSGTGNLARVTSPTFVTPALGTPSALVLTNATLGSNTVLAPLASPTFTGTVSGITATMVGLGSVTNNAQTQSAIVPNTAPSAGQMLVGNAGGTAYAPVTMSGSCTMASTGAISCSGSGASTTLNNLGTTSINAALLFRTGLSLGSASAPPQNLFFYGSGTYGSGSMEITAATGTTAYTAIVPTTNASDTFAMLGVGNAFTAANSLTLAVAASATDGFGVATSTAATSGNQKWSPDVYWTSNGWGTTGGTSQAVKFRSYVVPVQGTVPTGTWTLDSNVNGGAFGNALMYSSGGALTLATGSTAQIGFGGSTSSFGAIGTLTSQHTWVAAVLGDGSGATTFQANNLYALASGVLGWAAIGQSPDTGLSRGTAGLVEFGTGASGSTAGSWKATNGTTVIGGMYECTHGSNATCGVSTLSGGTVTVSTTAIGALAAAGAAGYAVSLTELNCSGTCAGVWVGTVTAATSFVINGAATDNSNVYWEIKYVN